MQYCMLGPLEVVHGSRPIDLGSPKQRAVLAVLLISRGRVVSSDRIVHAVWGDAAPGSVTASLQAYISNLRRVLRDGSAAASPIVRHSSGYQLDVPADDVDASRFLSLLDAARVHVESQDWRSAAAEATDALALWRGAVLEELRDEDWVRAAAGRLDERRSECRELLITALLGCGRFAEAVVEAERLRTAEPLRERGAWLQMLALHRAGRTPDALEVYRAHAGLLDAELGLEPGPSLRDLQAGILRQDPAIAAWPGVDRERGVPGIIEPDRRPDPEDADGDGAQSSFVGRRRELDLVMRMRARRRAGIRWLVITGPAGMGKTRLAEEALALWRSQGSTVIRAGCPEDEGMPPWWPIRALVRGLGTDPDVLLTPPPGTDADAARYVVYDRLENLLRASLTDDTIALIDDLQWADAASLRWLTHLAASGAAPLTLVVTVRDDGQRRPAVEKLLAAIARGPGNRQLALAPLGQDEVRELASLVSGDTVDDDEAVLLAEQTGGNPFFVGEVARLPRDERMAGGVPLAVRSVLRRRLSTVDAAVLQVLRTAAVMNDPLDVDLLCEVTELDREALADLLDAAADEHLIVPAPDSGSYRFAHGLLRDEVLAGLSLPRRQRLHARVAEALRVTGAQDRLGRRAAHLEAAYPLVAAAEVFSACCDAARDAEERWLSESAARWWEAAIRAYDHRPEDDRDDETRDDLVVAQVSALARAGRGETVLEVVETGIAEAVRDGRILSAGRLAATLLRTAGAWPWASYTEDPRRLMARLIAIEPQLAGDPSAHARVLAVIAVGSYYDLDTSLRDRLSRRAIEVAGRSGDPDVLADALLGRALALAGVTEAAEEAIEVLDRLAALPHRLSTIDAVLRHNLLTLVMLMLGRIDEMAEHLHAGIEGSDGLRLAIARVQLRWAEGTLTLWRGDLEQAELLYRRAYDLHRQTELYVMGVHELGIMAVRWEQGRLAEVEGVPRANEAMMPYARAALALAAGRLEEGDALTAAALSGPRVDVWTTAGELVLLAHEVADARLEHHARPLLERMGHLAGRLGTIGQVGVVDTVSLALARLHALLGERDEARRHAQEALAQSEASSGRRSVERCRRFLAELDAASPVAG